MTVTAAIGLGAPVALADPKYNVNHALNLNEATGSKSVAAALGAHGPDLKDCKGAIRFAYQYGNNDFLLTAIKRASQGKPSMIGIKGAWGHGAFDPTTWLHHGLVALIYSAVHIAPEEWQRQAITLRSGWTMLSSYNMKLFIRDEGCRIRAADHSITAKKATKQARLKWQKLRTVILASRLE